MNISPAISRREVDRRFRSQRDKVIPRLGRSLVLRPTAMLVLFSAIGFVGTAIADDSKASDELRMNQVQVIGSHNSYKTGFEPKFYQQMVKIRPATKELDYAHPPLTDQLNLGLRSLEIDVYHDPQGGRYAKPLGLADSKLAYDPDKKMLKPGFKVFHVQEIDFRSNCLTLEDALTEVSRWSEQHPRHLPIVITFNLKDDTIPMPGATKPLPFDKATLDLLDQAFLKHLGKQKMITPDDVRGQAASLEAAIQSKGWPQLGWARGRFLLMMDEQGQKVADYTDDHASLKGRVMFVNTPPGNPEAAVLIRNSPVDNGDAIAKLVKQGYIVRTRADSGTNEARTGDYARFEAAKKSGAQIISTDYYLADWRLNPAYRIRFEDHACARWNPLIGPNDQANETNESKQPTLRLE